MTTTTLTAHAQTPDTARKRSRSEFLGKIGGLVAGIRRASQKAEIAITRAADRKWLRDNPEGKPPVEFPTANDSHLAELEAATDTLLAELNEAIANSHAFN